MIAQSIEPLQPEIWFDQVRTLAERIARLGDDPPEAVLRKAYYLVQLTPGPLRDVIHCELDEESFERLLDGGAYDAAVTALVCPPVGFEISRGPGEAGVGAVVHLPVGSGTGTARGDSVAKALLAAWSHCLGELHAGAERELNRDRGPRRARSAPLPRSSRH